MKIGLFALETGRNVGGLEIYETNLIRALARIDQTNQYSIFCLDPIVPQKLQINAPNFQFHVLRANRFKGVAWDAPCAMRREKIDLFHAIFVPPPFTRIPYAFTMHGSEVLARPDFYPLPLRWRIQFLFRRAIKHARLILCVSNYVRDYLEKQHRVPADRLATIYPGCDFAPVPTELARSKVEREFNLRARYILSVGRIEPRKNPIAVLRAYDAFRRSTANPPKLCFAGMKTWSAKDFDRTVRELSLAPFIVELSHVPHESLPALYSAAEFTVFASLWEGFGLPAVEAMACGSPLITSNNTSLPEITAGAALLVDALSIESISAAMLSLHENASLRIELKHKGMKQAGKFTWDETARQCLRGYELTNLISQPPQSAR
jgi:glycosyltransferase involved in cell wall biosynthesis